MPKPNSTPKPYAKLPPNVRRMLQRRDAEIEQRKQDTLAAVEVCDRVQDQNRRLAAEVETLKQQLQEAIADAALLRKAEVEALKEKLLHAETLAVVRNSAPAPDPWPGATFTNPLERGGCNHDAASVATTNQTPSTDPMWLGRFDPKSWSWTNWFPCYGVHPGPIAIGGAA